jgi:hypothetical protein
MPTTDEDLVPLRKQLKAARALLGFGQLNVQEETSISTQTVVRIETCDPTKKVRPYTLQGLKAYYESQGVEFAPDGWVRLNEAVYEAQDEARAARRTTP